MRAQQANIVSAANHRPPSLDIQSVENEQTVVHLFVPERTLLAFLIENGG